MNTPAKPEFSRPVELARLGGRVGVYPIVATPEERFALARRFDLLTLDSLEAEIRLERVGDRTVRLEGTLSACVVQACVVTLEPVASNIADRFAMMYAPDEPQARVVVELESEVMEPIEGDAIDIGEAVAQQLALLLEPYPRASGARLDVPSPESSC